jgi:hypothetical protein
MFPARQLNGELSCACDDRSGDMWKWIRNIILLRWLMRFFGRRGRTRRVAR